jgi:hypothetical protein
MKAIWPSSTADRAASGRVPSTFHSFGSLSLTVFGSGSFIASSATAPYVSALPPNVMTPFVAVSFVGVVFHRVAAACSSSTFAVAPTLRYRSNSLIVVNDPAVIWNPISGCA